MDLEIQPGDRILAPPIPNDTPDECQLQRKMRNFKEAILKDLAASEASSSISQDLESYVEKKLQELFPTLDTPDHPPYASMIERAIMELDEEGGSTEKAISSFITKEYKDLPWAHATLLQHHLRKLCWDGEIGCSKDGKYMLLSDDGDSGQQTCGALKMCLDDNDEDVKFCSSLMFLAEQFYSETTLTTSSDSDTSFTMERKQRKKSLAKANRNVESSESKKQDCGQAIVIFSSSSLPSSGIDLGESLLTLDVIDELKQPEERGGKTETGQHKRRYYEGEEIVCGLMARQSMISSTNGCQRTVNSCCELMPLSIELAKEMVQQTRNACGEIGSVSGAISVERDIPNQQNLQVYTRRRTWKTGLKQETPVSLASS